MSDYHTLIIDSRELYVESDDSGNVGDVFRQGSNFSIWIPIHPEAELTEKIKTELIKKIKIKLENESNITEQLISKQE
jgi:hypothetical protein